MKHQGECYMDVSANFSLPLCWLSVSEDFSFSHSYLKYLQRKWGVDICFFPFSFLPSNFTVLSWKSSTWQPVLFLVLFFLRPSCHKMLFTALDFHMFLSPFRHLEVKRVPPGGFDLFFFNLLLLCPIWHWIVFPVCYWLQTSGGLMAVSQKSSHQKAVSVVWDQRAVIRWGQILTLW